MKRALVLLVGMMICTAGARGADPKITAVTATGEYEKPTTTFTPDTPKVWVLIKYPGAKHGDKIRSVWVAEDVGDVPANTKIIEDSMTVGLLDNSGSFSMTKPNNGWPVGKYHVDLYANDKLATTVKFSIGDGGKPAQPPATHTAAATATAPAPATAKPTAAAEEEKQPKVGSKEEAVKFPEDDPAFTIEFPANWTHEVDKGGTLQCKVANDDTYSFSLMALEDVHNNSELKAALPEAAKLLAKEMKLKKFLLGDYVTGKSPNGVLFSGIMGDGTVEGTEFNVMVHAFEPRKGKYYAIVTAATKESDADHETEYDEVTDSITPIEK